MNRAAPAVELARSVKAARAAELVALYVVIPLLLRWRVVPLPRIAVLALVTAGCLAALWRDRGFDRRQLALGDVRGSLRPLAARAALAAGAVLALVLLLCPAELLALPRRWPERWVALVVLYPFLSAWPQEVVFRVWFFHRYEGLLGPRAALAVNALLFGFLHVVYPNAVAPLLSIPAGLLLALTWRRARRIGPVWLEHVAYGLVLFTLGLGGYFLDGRP